MVKHIVIWQHDDRFTADEKTSNGTKIKESLEALKDIIPGIVSLKVYTDFLQDESEDIVLDSVFESVEALEHYQNHPEHIKAGSFVKSVLKNRKCVDYME
ncbi:MAG: Dabb family protein [Anaerocolumna sp.]